MLHQSNKIYKIVLLILFFILLFVFYSFKKGTDDIRLDSSEKHVKQHKVSNNTTNLVNNPGPTSTLQVDDEKNQSTSGRLKVDIQADDSSETSTSKKEPEVNKNNELKEPSTSTKKTLNSTATPSNVTVSKDVHEAFPLYKTIYFGKFVNIDISKIKSENLRKLFQLETVPLVPKSDVPKFIHRIFMNSKTPDNAKKDEFMNGVQKTSIRSFKDMNPDYHQFLWSLDDAHEFMEIFFPKYADNFKKLPKIIFKADLLRYILLDVFGGIYSDLDVTCLTPIDTWPEFYLKGQKNTTGKVTSMFGLEVRAESSVIPEWHKYWPRDIQICQWTIVSAPRSSLIDSIVFSMLGHILTIPESKLKDYDVMEVAGPGIWTDLVLDWAKQRDVGKEKFFEIKDKALGIESALFLPIYAYSPGPLGGLHEKMGVINAGLPGTLVRHHFQGTWRHEKRK